MAEAYWSGGYIDDPVRFKELYDGVKRHIPLLLKSVASSQPFGLVENCSSVPLFSAESVEGEEDEFTPVAEEFTLSSGLRVVMISEYDCLPFSAHIRFPWAIERNWDSTGQYALFDDGAIRETPIYPGCLMFAMAPCITIPGAEEFLSQLQAVA